MAVKVFLTGVTGYIGGTAFDSIYNAHKDYQYTLLVRSEAGAKEVKAKYPTVNIVYGSLGDAAVIEKAAAEADVVIHTADSSDDIPSAQAIIKGLREGHTAEKPGYWIHLSGTGILTWYDAVNNRGGEPPLPDQKYYDVDGVDRILTLPDEAFHRDVEKIVQAANSDSVKIAIVSPPAIYGAGSGPVKQKSAQIPGLARTALTEGYVPVVGAGKTEWDNVHIDDLKILFLKLVEATQDPSKKDNPEIFGPKAYFFASNGVHLWSDIANQIVDEVKKQGYKADIATKEVTLSDVKALKSGTETWGQNSKGVPQRAKKYLDWEAKAVPVEDTIAEVVSVEAKGLGL